MRIDVKVDANALDGMGAEIYKAAAGMPGLRSAMMQIASAKAASVNSAMLSASNGRVRGPFFPSFKSGVPGSIVAASVSMTKSDFRGKGGMASLARKTGALRW